jgi:hypothetical protein
MYVSPDLRYVIEILAWLPETPFGACLLTPNGVGAGRGATPEEAMKSAEENFMEF